MYKEYFTLGTRGFLKDLASLRSARALNEATCAQSKVLFVHYRNITPPHYDTRSIVNSYYFLKAAILCLRHSVRALWKTLSQLKYN